MNLPGGFSAAIMLDPNSWPMGQAGKSVRGVSGKSMFRVLVVKLNKLVRGLPTKSWMIKAIMGCLVIMITGCANRTEGPVLLSSKSYESHSRVIDIRQTPHDEARAIALISKKTMSPPEDLAGFIADAQRFGRRLGADDCAIEVVSDPLGGFVLHGYLQVGRWRNLTDAVKPAGFEKIIEEVMKSFDQ